MIFFYFLEIPDGTRSNLNTNDKHIKDETLTRDQVTNTDSSHENQFKSDCKHLDSNSKTWILRNKTNVKQQLCRTPICSVNTVDNTRNTKNYTELFLYEAIDFLRDINVYNRSNDNVYHTIQNDYLYYDIFNITTKPYKPLQDIQPLDNISTHRILPEVRVAKIVQQMEKEINPLKVMLNEIISKCSSLGLTKIKYQHSMFNNEINAEKEMNNVKSNRVVYSIVFDG
ncbi:unnamed protein product [Diatraea saccharalis]|uniref:Uncharacterized protein n=1 Tax=Diatraea saccharalis TaxID=40085 RepID=A0A9N9WAL5_9NEOP|nr:unnamed protein product [Diatraea saccharalis]